MKILTKMTKKQAKLEAEAMVINMHNAVMCYIQEPEAFDLQDTEEQEYSFDMNDPLAKYIIP